MSRRGSILSIIVGLTLLVGAPAIWWTAQPQQTVGDLDALGLPTETDPADPRLRDDGASGTPTADDDERIPNEETFEDDVSSGDPDTVDHARSAEPPLEYDTTPVTGHLESLAPPTRISIPSLGVDAPIDPVGIEPDGEMEIPDDIRRIGWFQPGMTPGRSGTAVLSGHVDARTQGRGAFFRLRELAVDDTLTITHDDGRERSWRVVARTSYGKQALPIEDIFVRSGEPRLALITCDGSFDSSTRSYQDNVVVYAVPA